MTIRADAKLADDTITVSEELLDGLLVTFRGCMQRLAVKYVEESRLLWFKTCILQLPDVRVGMPDRSVTFVHRYYRKFRRQIIRDLFHHADTYRNIRTSGY